ncbi:hypothetical protein F6476_06080 [Pseudomonas umsongensis]|jgi:hypothetical protein|uniref:Uncharacterized protein n=1 Tax=Pseudomonas umsongensis TaxID=198618 RepID=A0AAE6ZU43_9PSED|nr:MULTISPECIES: hypothetical protein [Pseudomonas]EPA93867.1 hypothetical protein PG5_56740 [Pseudomonas sp. G5(2012)]OXR33379.1 hypothetical protein PSUM_15255 [Pseudomonas umsongensis]QFG28807.1 hypothetical protein F6476_06080 [Pseudomonas umsongensis]QJC78394.1 hypothetical protein HGP31_08725 [Pseudomonas umsongensis]SDS54363.1 hypothetical protein SAMN04490206_0955 [Pseudomonas umsongensis]
MQGMIISNPKLEFLRPVLERWFDCIDRYNAVRGDNETPYWLDEKANLGLLSAAAWMAEMVTLQQSPTRKQTEEGERNGRADLFIATTEDRAWLQATQRWPRVNSLNLTQALLDITSDAKKISYASDLRIGCLFVAPHKSQQGATPEELQDMVDDLQKEHCCAVAWYFPYAYRKLRNEAGHYHPGIAVLLKEARG